MTDTCEGDSWGNNATQPANDEWNTASGGVDSWNEGGAGGASFNNSGPAPDFDSQAEGPVDDYRPKAQGGCFNCGEGKYTMPHPSCY